MTAEQVIAVIAAAKAAGISWLKAEGLEFRCGGSTPAEWAADVEKALTEINKHSFESPPPFSTGATHADDLIDPSNRVSLSSVRSAPSSDPVGDVPLSPEEEAEIKHQVEEMKSVMQLDDEELLDRLFPEPKEEIEAAS